MGDAVWALLVGLFLASLVAFRRARGVLTPETRRALPRQSGLTFTRVVAGIVAFGGIVWLTRQLFT